LWGTCLHMHLAGVRFHKKKCEYEAHQNQILRHIRTIF
jgi:hypothetical protein